MSNDKEAAIIKTSAGEMVLEFWPDVAPKTVENFKALARKGFYDGTAFHRIVKGFVVQGGMSAARSGAATHPADRWVHPLKGEFRTDIKHDRGIVSMARTSDPDSATTSFFLVLGPSPHLDGQYSVFGRVVEGLEVLDAFEKEELDGEAPKRRLEIVSAAIDGN